MNGKEEIKALTGLRGIGALWVFMFHLLSRYDIPVIRQGNLAVPMFFVLSGFILFLVHEADFRKMPNLGTLRIFFASRFARIYPLHLFVLLVLLLVALELPGFTGRYDSQRFSLPNLLASVFLIQTWGIGHFALFKDASDAWNGPAWSLSAEIAYYVSFPWVAHALFVSVRRGLVMQLVALSGILVFAVYGILSQDSETYTRSLICGWFGFCFGMSVCVLALRGSTLPTWIAEATGILLVILKLIFQELNPGIFVLGVGMLIYALTRRDSFLAQFFSSRAVYFSGQISFSIYIIHWPMIQVLNYFESRIDVSIVTADVFRFALIPIVFITASLTYAKIELPTRRILRRFILGNPSTPALPIV